MNRLAPFLSETDFLDHYFALQYRVSFDAIIPLQDAVFGYSRHDTSPYWNHIYLPKPTLTPDTLIGYETTCQDRDRLPAFYIVHNDKFSKCITILTKAGYTPYSEDAWMTYAPEKTVFPSVKFAFNQVRTVEELDQFVELMDQCYPDNDPQNPYGNLGTYLDMTRQAWLQKSTEEELTYYTIMHIEKNKLCGVGAVILKEQMGYLCNVGTLPEERGQGVGKAAIHEGLRLIKKAGLTLACLATEHHQHPFKVYTHMGFETVFTAQIWAKSLPH